jgi:hypothetical protein
MTFDMSRAESRSRSLIISVDTLFRVRQSYVRVSLHTFYRPAWLLPFLCVAPGAEDSYFYAGTHAHFSIRGCTACIGENVYVAKLN